MSRRVRRGGGAGRVVGAGVLVFGCLFLLLACGGGPAHVDRGPSDERTSKRDARLDWWREARFGLFIHFGLYAILEGKHGGKTGYGEWIMNSAHIPVREYEKLVKRFQPSAFDADAWVRAARDAGMGYMVVTTKHHDGFCLFDSALTYYDIASTPFRRDLIGELANACRKGGLRVGFYHSIMDWHHKDYLPRRAWEKRSARGADFGRYLSYLRGQVRELLTRYGRVDLMWFDGQWERTWRHEYGSDLYDLCRQLQPSVIVNDRVDLGRQGHSGRVLPGFKGDYGTPEQTIPSEGPELDWETCMTMNRHWGWNASDTIWKSSDELIRKLVDIASKGGNFLLNVGPKPDGSFPDKALVRLREIGRWTRGHGEAIRGTTRAELNAPSIGRYTKKRVGGTQRYYLHLFEWPKQRDLLLPGFGTLPREVHAMSAPDLPLESKLGEGGIVVTLPEKPTDPVVPVLVLEFEGQPLIYEAPKVDALAPLFLKEREVRLQVRNRELSVRYTVDGSIPSIESKLYVGPIRLTSSVTLKARSFCEGRPVSEVVEQEFRQVPLLPALPKATVVQPGLICERFAGTWDKLPDFEALDPGVLIEKKRLRLGEDRKREHFAARFSGALRVEKDGIYRLQLASDDGSKFYLSGTEFLDNDGLHGMTERERLVPLQKGWHGFRVEYFNKSGSAALRVRLGKLGQPLKDLSPESLGHR